MTAFPPTSGAVAGADGVLWWRSAVLRTGVLGWGKMVAPARKGRKPVGGNTSGGYPTAHHIRCPTNRVIGMFFFLGSLKMIFLWCYYCYLVSPASSEFILLN
jgi:hypothetical protein